MNNNIQIRVDKLEQLVNKEIFVGKMTILELKDIIKYTNRRSNEQFIYQPEGAKPDEEYLYYQRLKSSDRAYEIKLFFLKHIWNKFFYEKERVSPLGTFPSAIILAFNSFEGRSKVEYNYYLETDPRPDSVFVDDASNSIIIPKTNQGLIVDGQHRIAGLELLLDEVLKEDIVIKKANRKDFYIDTKNIPRDFMLSEIQRFQFIVSILSDFDLYEQSEIFATVNFNQQKVNKSFYYDIFGTASSAKTIERLLHDITSHLNYKEDSPLFNKIKMLGNGPGYFSQAFFVDALIPQFKNGTFQFVYTDFQDGGKIYKLVPDFLKAYFEAIFDVFSEFLPKKDEKIYSHNLLKTTGMGALILLLPTIFNIIKNSNKISRSEEVLALNREELVTLVSNIFKDISGSGPDLFGEQGRFSKGSGKGLQRALFGAISKDLGLSESPNEDSEALI